MASDDAAAFAREAQHGAPHRPPALPETLAWAVATLWSEQLPPLRLVCDATASDPLALVQSYEWVHWQLATVPAAATARATVVAWFWLTSCEGYSGEENPRFWKRVLGELQRHDGDAVVSDAVRFFDRPGREFPRVHVETREWSAIQVFTGRESTPLDAMILRSLQRMFQRLQPYVASERLQRSIPVRVQSLDLEFALKHGEENGLHVPGPSNVTPRRLREVSETSSGETFRDALKAELAAAPTAHQLMKLPAFEAHSAFVPTWPLASTLHPRDGSLQTVALRVERVMCHDGWGDAQFYERGNQAASQLRQCFGVGAPTRPSHLLSLFVDRPWLSMSLVAAVCSAVPHSTAVSTLQLDTESPSGQSLRTFTNLDWAWIGYAIFYPDTDQSTCSDLELAITAADVSPDSIRALQLMARGNNLANVENPTHLPPSMCYYVAHLSLETEIRRYPSPSAPVILRHTIPTERFSVDNAATQDDWVRVVVPGFGFGWVPSAAVVDITSHPPGKPRLQGLRLRSSPADTVVPRALDFVMNVGERLTRLDVTICGDLSAETLLRLLVASPNLKTLNVSHKGSLWASPSLLARGQHLPLLQELSLTLQGATLLLGSQHLPSLRRLKALRVNAVPDGDNFPRNRATVLAFLQAHPSIEYFHWCDLNSPGRINTNRNVYHARRQRSHLLVGELPHPVSSSGLCLTCRFALVGAVDAKRRATPASAFGRLEEDLLSLIFSFSPRCGLRDMWIGP